MKQTTMRRYGFRMAIVVMTVIVCFSCLQVDATAAPAPPAIATPAGLSVSQIKVTGDEFVVLQNTTGAVITNLSSYWLYGFNNVNPLTAGVSSSSQQLPSGSLAAGQTLLLSAASMPTCGAAIAGKLSISLTDGGGFLQVIQMSMPSGSVLQLPIDTVSWSAAASGAIPNLPSSTKAPNAVWYRYRSGTSYGWQQADLDPAVNCQLSVTVTGSVNPMAISNLAASGAEPATTIAAVAATPDGAVASVPASDAGLAAPLITELLPNPASPATDDTDEFIELYNPNSKSFDLSNFSLQVASSTAASARTYGIPVGTLLEPKSFMAFTSEQTHLSMSNTGGQVWLLDPTTKIIAQTDAYATAKDGQAWILAGGSWAWSTTPTPALANILTKPATSASKTAAKPLVSKKTATGATVAAAVVKSAATKLGFTPEATAAAKVHGYVLVGIAGLAVLYGAYEYRTDLANHVLKFRAKFKLGGKYRSKTQR